jgi:hemoglobin-like flavoprotein
MPSWLNRKTKTDGNPPEEESTVSTSWTPPPGYGDGDPSTTVNLMRVPGAHLPDSELDAGADDEVVDPRATDPDIAVAQGVRQAADANYAERGADSDEGEHCPTCGHATPPVRAFLEDTLQQVSTRAPVVFASFYARLFDQRPDLAELFPADLTDPESDPEGGGHAQREKLVGAASAVASHFNSGNPDSMAGLNKALDQMGGTHGEARMTVADENWPNGRRPLLQRDYDVVNDCLIATLREFQGDTWTPMHHAAWWTAMTYVANRMGAAQILAAPRHAR